MDINNIKINTYLDEICSLIKNKRVHSEVKNELLAHIKKLLLHYKKLGYSEDESICLSLKDMGSSKKLGNELNKTHKPSFDFKLLGILSALIIIGFIGVLTFASTATKFFGSPMYSLEAKNAIYFPIIIVFFLIGSVINFKWLKKLSIPFYILALVLCIPSFLDSSNLFALMILNKSIEIPILFLFGLSGIYTMLKFDNYKSYIISIILTLLPLLAMIFSSSILRYNKSTAPLMIDLNIFISLLCYAIGSFILIYIHSKKVKLLIPTIILQIAIIIATLYNAIIILLFYNNAWSFSTLKIILSSSKLIGNSGSLGALNAFYPITGMITHFGWIPAIILIGVLLYFVFRLYKNSLKINNLFGKSLALSISTIISVRIVIGILMNLNLFPFIAFPLPFVSFSSTSLVTLMFLLGIFTNIYKVKTLSKI